MAAADKYTIFCDAWWDVWVEKPNISGHLYTGSSIETQISVYMTFLSQQDEVIKWFI